MTASAGSVLSQPAGAPRAAEAIAYFAHRVRYEIGGLTATLGGLDALAFSGGIGEHSSTLRAAVDEFFTAVTVNDADAIKRAARLGLLDAFRAAVHKVADFSRIEG